MTFESDYCIEDAVFVHIDGTRETEDGRFQMAGDNLAHDFSRWLVKHPEIRSYRGGASGLGIYVGWFPAEHKSAIEAFFKASQDNPPNSWPQPESCHDWHVAVVENQT